MEYLTSIKFERVKSLFALLRKTALGAGYSYLEFCATVSRLAKAFEEDDIKVFSFKTEDDAVGNKLTGTIEIDNYGNGSYFEWVEINTEEGDFAELLQKYWNLTLDKKPISLRIGKRFVLIELRGDI